MVREAGHFGVLLIAIQTVEDVVRVRGMLEDDVVVELLQAREAASAAEGTREWLPVACGAVAVGVQVRRELVPVVEHLAALVTDERAARRTGGASVPSEMGRQTLTAGKLLVTLNAEQRRFRVRRRLRVRSEVQDEAVLTLEAAITVRALQSTYCAAIVLDMGLLGGLCLRRLEIHV